MHMSDEPENVDRSTLVNDRTLYAASKNKRPALLDYYISNDLSHDLQFRPVMHRNGSCYIRADCGRMENIQIAHMVFVD